MRLTNIGMLVLAAGLVAGCGGGGSERAEIMKFEEDLQTSEEARRAAEAALARERERKAAEIAAARADAAREAEQRAQDAEREAEEAAREQERLVALVGKTRQELTRARARLVFDGLHVNDAGSVSEVTPRYRASAEVTTTPSVTFLNPTTGSSGQMFRTSHSNRGGTHIDRLDVYSNVEAPKNVPFKDSTYNVGNAVVNAVGEVVSSFPMGTDNRDDVASGSFDRASGTPKSFNLVDRGFATQDEKDAAVATCTPGEPCPASNLRVRDTERYTTRWTAEVSGTLGGASGRFQCEASAATTPCTVQNRGDDFHFVGPWNFRPSSATTNVRVPDADYMYFGWWARQILATEAWSFETFHGPTASRVTADNLTGVTGIATYQGPAVGQYAIYQPLGDESSHGAFTATATLTADFTDSMVYGIVDDFDDHPDWSLTLKHGAIAAGAAGNPTNGVSWSIGGNAHEGGLWEANFYSNLAAADRNNSQPTGIAGTFQATYTTVGKLDGAFGAHRQ